MDSTSSVTKWTIRQVWCIIFFLSGPFQCTKGIQSIESIKQVFFPQRYLSGDLFTCSFCLHWLYSYTSCQAEWGFHCKCHHCNSVHELLKIPTVRLGFPLWGVWEPWFALRSKGVQFRKEPSCVCKNECPLCSLNLSVKPPKCWQLSQVPTLWQKSILKKSLNYAWFFP